MGIVLFYYTLCVLLVIILTAAACLSAYLVSHKRSFLFAFLGFLAYFFDVALVFQDDFIIQKHIVDAQSLFFIGSPHASVVTGCALIVAFCLLACEYLGEQRIRYAVVPASAFAALSLGALWLLPKGSWEEFVFYSMRSLALCWMLLFMALRYLRAKDEAIKGRLKRYRRLYVLLWVFGAAVWVENICFLLVLDPTLLLGGPLSFFPERNFAENALFIMCAFFAARNSFRALALRFESPPTTESTALQGFIDSSLEAFSRSHKLSGREQEVLRLVLVGKDNRTIAASLFLAISTVKVHVHSILQKTDCGNRQELIKEFWRTS
jgi:DNA-binding CsgD family transcriptional regulator